MDQKVLKEKFASDLFTIPHWIRINVKVNERINFLCNTFVFESHNHERVIFSLLLVVKIVRLDRWKLSVSTSLSS